MQISNFLGIDKALMTLRAAAILWLGGFSVCGHVLAQTPLETLLANDICILSPQTGTCLSPESQLDHAVRAGDSITFGVRVPTPPPNVQITDVSYVWVPSAALLDCQAGTGGVGSDRCTIKIPAATTAKHYKVTLKMSATIMQNGTATKIRRTEVGVYTLHVPLAADTFGEATSFGFCDQDDASLKVIEPANLSSNPAFPYPAVVFFRGTGGGEKDVIGTASRNGYYVIDVGYTQQGSRLDNKFLPFNEAACAIRWVRAHSAWDESGHRIANPRNVRGTGKSLQVHPGRIFAAGFSQGGALASHVSIVKRTRGVAVEWNAGLKAAIDAAVTKPAWAPVDNAQNKAVNATWSAYSSEVQGVAVVASASEWSTFLSFCEFPAIAMEPDLGRFNHEVSYYWGGVLQNKRCYDPTLPAADRTQVSVLLAFEGLGGWNYPLGQRYSENHRVWSAMSWLALAKNNSYAPPILNVTGTTDVLVPVVEGVIENRYLRSLGRAVKSVVSNGGHGDPFSNGSPLVVTQFFDAIGHGLANHLDVTRPAGLEAAFQNLYGRSSSGVLCPDTRRPNHGFYCDE